MQTFYMAIADGRLILPFEASFQPSFPIQPFETAFQFNILCRPFQSQPFDTALGDGPFDPAF